MRELSWEQTTDLTVLLSHRTKQVTIQAVACPSKVKIFVSLQHYHNHAVECFSTITLSSFIQCTFLKMLKPKKKLALEQNRVTFGTRVYHPMRNFPYDRCCVKRDLPLNSISCCIIKCRARRLSKFDLSFSWKKWHWRVSNPCAFSVKERRCLTEMAHCDRAPKSSITAVVAGSCCFGGLYTWMLSYARTTVGIVRAIFARGILYYRYGTI